MLALGGAALAGALAAAQPSAALTITPYFDSSITSLANAATVEAAFNAVAKDYATSFANPVTVNVQVSWGSVGGYYLPSNAVGASVDSLYGYFSYSQVQAALTQTSRLNPSDTALATAVKHLPPNPPQGVTRYVIPSAEAKALGLIPGSLGYLDGAIGFAGNALSYDYNPSNGITAGTYDFEAVAAHELDEVLGRISGVTSTNPAYLTPFDLYRYAAWGVPTHSYTATSYFSIDGGVTNLGTFNNSPSGGDRGDFQTLASSKDVQDAFVSTGQGLNLTAADLTALDVLGWTGSNLGDTGVASPTGVAFSLITSVPEPSAWALLIGGMGMMGLRLRVRRRREVAGAA